MAYQYDEYGDAYDYEDNRSMQTLVTGLLIGALVGGALMLFLAPASGKKTLRKLQKKTMKLREHTMDTVEDAMKQARHRANKVTAGVRRQTEGLTDRSQSLLGEQKERVAELVSTGRKKVHLPGR